MRAIAIEPCLISVRTRCCHSNISHLTLVYICCLQVALLQEGWPNTATSWVEVQYPPEAKEAAASSRLGVCVKPLYGGYNRALGLVEFISMYQLLGATDFVFYNHSVGAEVNGGC